VIPSHGILRDFSVLHKIRSVSRRIRWDSTIGLMDLGIISWCSTIRWTRIYVGFFWLSDHYLLFLNILDICTNLKKSLKSNYDLLLLSTKSMVVMDHKLKIVFKLFFFFPIAFHHPLKKVGYFSSFVILNKASVITFSITST
jgi:hypothetical protein